MHPELVMSMAESRQAELIAKARRRARARESASTRGHKPAQACARVARGGIPHRNLPMWRVTWTRETLAAAGTPGQAGRSWVIIISASRVA